MWMKLLLSDRVWYKPLFIKDFIKLLLLEYLSYKCLFLSCFNNKFFFKLAISKFHKLSWWAYESKLKPTSGHVIFP
jgi:hypothetical protein